ncbi:MAG: dephospho-CoA kinase [Nitriliruptorales bacterium]|nr:dephospho-CoA kinase [Nitriliruptorales bacterium]
MFLVGLTGGIASGKSAVAGRLVQHGAELVDADTIARGVVMPDTPTWHKIVQHFGSEVLDQSGFIDRPRLGAVVFGDPSKRALLNQLTHPPIVDEIASRLELLTAYDGVVVLDVPLLVEAGVDRGYDAVLVVATKPEAQLRRLRSERAMSEADARARIAAQAPLEEKLARATHVIWNEGSLEELERRTDEVAGELTALAREKAAREASGLPDD